MSVFAPAYELFGWAYFGSFSDELYDNSIYGTMGSTNLIMVAILMIIYYYVLSNYGSLYKFRYWFLWLIFIVLLNFGTAFYIVDRALFNIYGGEYPDDYLSHIWSLSLINAMWASILGFALSLILKIKSIQASRTPF